MPVVLSLGANLQCVWYLEILLEPFMAPRKSPNFQGGVDFLDLFAEPET